MLHVLTKKKVIGINITNFRREDCAVIANQQSTITFESEVKKKINFLKIYFD